MLARLTLLVLLAVAAGGSARGQGLPVVVLDPGHGGVKDGAVSERGDKEKAIALELARALKAELEKVPVKVLLTREGDGNVDLKERIKLANDAGADLFVSIHLNSMPPRARKRAHGIETYFLSAEATGEQAKQVAALENAEAGEQAAPSDDLAFILNDLAQTQAHRDASKLAYAIHQRLVTDLKASDRGVHQAPFIVLMGAQMPAILAEVGFLSHPSESQKLMEKRYQARIVRSLAAGIEGFLRETGGRDHAIQPSASAPSGSAEPVPAALDVGVGGSGEAATASGATAGDPGGDAPGALVPNAAKANEPGPTSPDVPVEAPAR